MGDSVWGLEDDSVDGAYSRPICTCSWTLAQVIADSLAGEMVQRVPCSSQGSAARRGGGWKTSCR